MDNTFLSTRSVAEEQAAIADVIVKEKGSLSQKVENTNQLIDTMRHWWFSPSQCAEVCIRIKEILPQLIKGPEDFRTLFALPFSAQQRQEIYEEIRGKLTEMDIDDFTS